MWINLSSFVDRITTLNNRSKFTGISALGDMYNYLNGISWLNRLVLKIGIQIYYDGEERDGYLSVFWMYSNMRAVIRNQRNKSGDVDDT